jgi:hypothetical protein
LVVFLHFGNGINQLDLIDFLKKLINENNYSNLEKKINIKFKDKKLLIKV